MKTTLFRRISTLMTCAEAMKKQGRKIVEQDLSFYKNYSMIVTGKTISWIGPDQQVPKKLKVTEELDCRSFQIYPGFIECHTHLGFAGHRADEFEMRLNGVSYQQINQNGGGIQSTMKQTRKINYQSLFEQTQARANQFLKQGVTTLEAKSGYGLDLKTEEKVLQVYSELKGPKIIKTYLGPHSLPPEFQNHDEYIDYICKKVLPRIHKKKLAERVDIFVEKGFFTSEQALRYFRQAKSFGFEVVIHADQFSLSGGSDVALQVGALSADHVIEIGDLEINKFSKSNVTCVLLPMADFYMRCSYPKARKMIDSGVRVAVATDFNPGSSPSQNLSFCGLLARLEMKMTLPEVIGAYTAGASYALNKQSLVGSLEVGKSADFVLSRKDWTELFYSADSLDCDFVYIDGRRRYSASHYKI
ncbi:MAG: imidazolonepropionase [Pseudobdellovibrionaceae bacterium]